MSGESLDAGVQSQVVDSSHRFVSFSFLWMFAVCAIVGGGLSACTACRRFRIMLWVF